MPRIRVLPDILSNKIAAGEVVERPASVVKELVENSLDAQSSLIEVAIERGGLSEIRVSDNGRGMGPDDALLSLERYATSKIATDTDLFAIRTLGFRGEALPSMASVSHFEMVSREREAASGVRIVVEGGRILNVAETGAAPGTVISVKKLFFNVPVRRKFLKSESTEMGHIADTLLSISLGFPDVQFKLVHNGKVLRYLGAGDPFLRAVDVLGKEVEHHLFPVDQEGEGIRVRGWAASPDISRSSTQRIYLYVNGRHVRDRAVYKALFEGYKGRMMTGRYPVAILFLDVDPERVDVNVHPTKHEVRFSDGRAVWAAVRDGVAQALCAEDHGKWRGRGEDRRRALGEIRGIVAARSGMRIGEDGGPGVSFGTEEIPRIADLRESGREFGRDREASGFRTDMEKEEAAGRPLTGRAEAPSLAQGGGTGERTGEGRFGGFPVRSSGMAPERRGTVFYDPASREGLWKSKGFYSELKVIGQLHDTYILCESEAGLVMVDQHAAHERVRYEALKRRHAQGGGASQQLLTPDVVDLGFREAAAAQELLPVFARLGLHVEPFGGNSFVIKAVPDLLAHADLVRVFADMAEQAVKMGLKEGGAGGVAEALDECLILMACHSAIRAHHALKPEEIRHLFEQLDACVQPSRCPHGRPIWVQWEKRFLEKSFGRLG